MGQEARPGPHRMTEPGRIHHPDLEGPGFLVPESSWPGQGASASWAGGRPRRLRTEQMEGRGGAGTALSYLHVARIRRGEAGTAVHVGEPVHAGGKLYMERCAAPVIGLYLVHRHRGSQRRGVGG